MKIETANTVMVSSGVALCIGGLVMIFTVDTFWGVVTMFIGAAISLFGAIVFKPF